jgi:hypothetical protein
VDCLEKAQVKRQGKKEAGKGRADRNEEMEETREEPKKSEDEVKDAHF